jgi:hypothetical protein
MTKQRENPKKTAAPTREQPTKTSVKSPVHPVEEMQAVIGNRAMGQYIQSQCNHHSSPKSHELTLPSKITPIQAKPQFGGLSSELIAASSRLTIQPKLTIGEPGDQYEQEADRVAAEVVNRINTPSRHSSSQGQPIQRRAIAGEASTDLDTAINSARGGGQPLEEGLQRSMGQAMGAEFSGVRIHADAQSDQLNQSIQARAFTTGQDVFFRSGEYNPGSRGGQELIAHELTHVVQQNGNGLPVQDKIGEQVIQRKRKKNANQQAATNSGAESVAIARIPAPVVHKGKHGAVIQDIHNPEHTRPSSSGDYLFSERGAGVKPLIMIGTKDSVLAFLKQKAENGIENQIKKIPDIYMGVSYYRPPAERFRGLFPLQEARMQVVKGFAGLLGEALGTGLGSTVGKIGDATGIKILNDIAPLFDAAEKIPDIIEAMSVGEQIKERFGSDENKKQQDTPGQICVMFHYLEDKGMSKIGEKKIHFKDIISRVEEKFRALN